jgi:hypothetical protein
MLEDEELIRAYKLSLRLPKGLEENPGLALTLLYVTASIIGLAYNFLFFRRFKINVLEFSETADFLMVVVREPLTVALALSGVLVYLVYGNVTHAVSLWSFRRWPKLRGTPEKRMKSYMLTRRLAPIVQVSFIGAYAFLFVVLYSNRQARLVRETESGWVTVAYRTDTPPSMAEGPRRAKLLGTTSRFIFLYHPASKTSVTVPLDAVAQLEWDARTRAEREADKAAAEHKGVTPSDVPAAAPVVASPPVKS